MSEAKTKCTKCGVEILIVTAERTGGLCVPCREDRTVPLMNTEEVEAELEAAAASLQTRAAVLGVPTQRIPIEEWQALAPELRDRSPLWLRKILSRHALCGVALEHRVPSEPCVRVFSFLSPNDFKGLFPQGSLYQPLLANNYVPIGYGQDGNLWLVEESAGAGGRVFLLELTDWNGGELVRTNGLRFVANRMAQLICGMGISEVTLS